MRVETDDGVVGVGSGDTMDGFAAFEHLFVGQDLLAIARHVRALKIRVDPRALEDGLAAVAATRAAVRDTMDIRVDLNQGWRMAGDTSRALDPVAAQNVTARLAEYGVLWVEEPLAGTDLRGLAGLRASVPGIRIAGGEMTRTFHELIAAIDADAFDVHQPDVVLAAGMLRTRTIADRRRRPVDLARPDATSGPTVDAAQPRTRVDLADLGRLWTWANLESGPTWRGMHPRTRMAGEAGQAAVPVA